MYVHGEEVQAHVGRRGYGCCHHGIYLEGVFLVYYSSLLGDERVPTSEGGVRVKIQSEGLHTGTMSEI